MLVCGVRLQSRRLSSEVVLEDQVSYSGNRSDQQDYRRHDQDDGGGDQES